VCTAVNAIEELAVRESDGVHVSLLWERATDRVVVFVEDHKLDETFVLRVLSDESALDVFHHPYAYASIRGLAPTPRGGDRRPHLSPRR